MERTEGIGRVRHAGHFATVGIAQHNADSFIDLRCVRVCMGVDTAENAFVVHDLPRPMHATICQQNDRAKSGCCVLRPDVERFAADRVFASIELGSD